MVPHVVPSTTRDVRSGNPLRYLNSAEHEDPRPR
jgi:hypothetical protein